jgi:uncharacterized protein YqjF (DUF2071 family)
MTRRLAERTTALPARLGHLVGSAEYYPARSKDFLLRFPGCTPPPYYRQIGERYFQEFERLRSRLTPAGQLWASRTATLLHQLIERLVESDPYGFAQLEAAGGDALTAVLYEMHSDAYLKAGFEDLPLTDLRLVLSVLDLRDLLTRHGLDELAEVATARFADDVADLLRRFRRVAGPSSRTRRRALLRRLGASGGGPWTMFQGWRNLLFLSWPLATAAERDLHRLVPDGMALDRFDGDAWLSVVAVRMTHVHAPRGPVLPPFIQVNLRTYVRVGAHRGVHFISVDCTSGLVSRVARRWFRLPYFQAAAVIGNDERPGPRFVRSRRAAPGADAELDCRYRPDGPVRPLPEDALAAFLLDRDRLFTVEAVSRGPLASRVLHLPWPTRAVTTEVVTNTIPAAAGVRIEGRPVHAVYSPGLDVLASRLESTTSLDGGRSNP